MEEIIQPGPKGLRVICGASGLDRLADISEGEQHRLLEHLAPLAAGDRYDSDRHRGRDFPIGRRFLSGGRPRPGRHHAGSHGHGRFLWDDQGPGPKRIRADRSVSSSTWPAAPPRASRSTSAWPTSRRKFLQTNVYYAGTLLKDERLCAAVRSRTPVVLAYPKSEISTSLAALAARLAGTKRRRQPRRQLLPESDAMVELKPAPAGR